jgi:hypothetical protein
LRHDAVSVILVRIKADYAAAKADASYLLIGS